MFTIVSPPNARIAVALPSSVWSRQTKPALVSAISFTGSSAAMNSASSGLSSGALGIPTLSWARWNFPPTAALALARGGFGRLLLDRGAAEARLALGRALVAGLLDRSAHE